MKPFVVLASLAVATVASAAELKDPAHIAAEWQRSVLSAQQALTEAARSLALPGSASKASALSFASEETPPRVYFNPKTELFPRTNRGAKKKTPGDVYTVPNPRSKEWKYRGESYWIVPLSS